MSIILPILARGNSGSWEQVFGFFGPTRSSKSNKEGWRGENYTNLANISGFSAYRGCQSAL